MAAPTPVPEPTRQWKALREASGLGEEDVHRGYSMFAANVLASIRTMKKHPIKQYKKGTDFGKLVAEVFGSSEEAFARSFLLIEPATNEEVIGRLSQPDVWTAGAIAEFLDVFIAIVLKSALASLKTQRDTIGKQIAETERAAYNDTVELFMPLWNAFRPQEANEEQLQLEEADAPVDQDDDMPAPPAVPPRQKRAAETDLHSPPRRQPDHCSHHMGFTPSPYGGGEAPHEPRPSVRAMLNQIKHPAVLEPVVAAAKAHSAIINQMHFRVRYAHVDADFVAFARSHALSIREPALAHRASAVFSKYPTVSESVIKFLESNQGNENINTFQIWSEPSDSHRRFLIELVALHAVFNKLYRTTRLGTLPSILEMDYQSVVAVPSTQIEHLTSDSEVSSTLYNDYVTTPDFVPRIRDSHSKRLPRTVVTLEDYTTGVEFVKLLTRQSQPPVPTPVTYIAPVPRKVLNGNGDRRTYDKKRCRKCLRTGHAGDAWPQPHEKFSETNPDKFHLLEAHRRGEVTAP